MPVVVNEARKKRARVADCVHRHGCRMDASVRGFPPIAVDEPAIAGGTDEGPSPLEMVTVGLAACQTVTIAKIAEAMGFAFDSLDVHAEADVVFRPAKIAMGPVPRFAAARMVVRLATDELPDRLAQLVAMVEERCPVTTLFADAGIAPDVAWDVRPTA